MHSPRSLLLPALAALLAALALAAQAHEGHDDAPAVQTSAAPRFAIASEQFELVGVIDGRRLSLFLDHAGDNSPVHDAQLELDLGGQNLAVTVVGEGLYAAELPQPLPDGETPVTATVMAGTDSDLLAGDIDWHAPASSAPAAPQGRKGLLAAAAGVLVAVGAVWAWRRRAAVPQRAGGAA